MNTKIPILEIIVDSLKWIMNLSRSRMYLKLAYAVLIKFLWNMKCVPSKYTANLHYLLKIMIQQFNKREIHTYSGPFISVFCLYYLFFIASIAFIHLKSPPIIVFFFRYFFSQFRPELCWNRPIYPRTRIALYVKLSTFKKFFWL